MPLPVKPQAPQGAPRTDYPPPSVEYRAFETGWDPDELEATRRAVEPIVADVWARIGRVCRVIVAGGVESIHLTYGPAIEAVHEYGPLWLFVTPDDGSAAWRAQVQAVVADAFAMALCRVLAAAVAGGDAVMNSLPSFREGAPAALWFDGLRGAQRDEAVEALTDALIYALMDFWGLPDA
jgi:hypothetical protein